MPDDQQQSPSVNSEDANLSLSDADDTSTSSAPSAIPTTALDAPYTGQDLTSPFDGQRPFETGSTSTAENADAEVSSASAETSVSPDETSGEVPIPPEGVDLPNEGEVSPAVTPQAPAGDASVPTENTEGLTIPPVVSANDQSDDDQITIQQ